MNHLFRECPVTKSVWRDLSNPIYVMFPNAEFLEWLTKMLVLLPSGKCRVYCGMLWAIWGDRNSRIHNKRMEAPTWQILKINFDGAFDERRKQSASGIVVRDRNGRVLLTKSELHSRLSKKREDIIIEGDSLSIIKKCNKPDLDKSVVGVYIQDICRLQAKCRKIRFEHTLRMANKLAHIIAMESLKRREEIYLIEAVPSYAEHQARHESVREPD
ncbi:Zinc finger, CCHC-type [Gossypium australe]|uniref:Zinc finger, CCHC-type n=1 Tax=Gossypium australe TaxID=47621 RepID=A0A5B6W1V5_9ROSI|nr:Zinc finger, CCHC-type [Gossypium australe]